jgi:predicted MPP superfamily phosphohydrolase
MRPQSIIFPVILLVLLIYTGYKATRTWPTRRALACTLAILFLTLILGWQFLYRWYPGVLDSGWFRAFAWASSLGLGLWATFILLSAPLDILGAVAVAIRRVGNRARVDPERRRFLSQWTALGVGWASAGIAGLGFVQAMRGPRVKEISISIPGLPKALEGLKIAHISDLHVGPTIQREYMDEVVRQTNALDPDLIVLTGDVADGLPAIIGRHLLPLTGLKARLGAYYVTGNHEYYWGVESWVETIRSLGLLPLLNENRVIAIGDAKLLLAGVTDSVGGSFLSSHRCDPRRAIQSDDECQLKVLLAHRPDRWSEAEELGFDLQLSGHTHGGQFFPWNVLMPIVYKYYRGLHRHGRMWIFVSSGTGYWGPADRFAIPSEIALLRLTAA